MESKKETKITLTDIKKQFIEDRLSELPYRVRVFVSTSAYQNPKNYNNLRAGSINALIEATDSDISFLNGGIRAVAMNISIRFLLPVDDAANADGDFSFIDRFRDELSNVFTDTNTIVLEKDDKHFIGAVSVGLPMGGELLQRQGIGKSFEYTCYIQIAFLENAINSSDVKFYLGDDVDNNYPIPYTTYSISRKNTLTANLYSTTTNGVSQVFAENSTFGVDIAMPAVTSGVIGQAVYNFLTRNASANQSYTLTMERNGAKTTEQVIFGEVIENGSGTENVSWQISLVPYIEAEDEEG